MTRLLHLFTALFAITLVLTACGGQQAAQESPESTAAPTAAPESEATEAANEEEVVTATEGYPVTVTDMLGRELTFEAPPERVVALYNGNFGNLATLGVRPVGALINDEMRHPRYFEDGESIPSVATDGNPDSFDLETIAAAEPDLILARSMEEVEAMESIAPVYIPLDTQTLEGLYAETLNLGEIFGVETEAQAAITTFQDRLAAYKALAPRDVSIMLPSARSEDLNAVLIRHGGAPDCALLNEIAICDWDDPTNAGGWSYETTAEAILEENPDYIYFRGWRDTEENLRDVIQANPLWTELDAVKNDRVLWLEDYPNPIASSLIAATRLIDTFAPLLYPNVFPEQLTDEGVQEILVQQ